MNHVARARCDSCGREFEEGERAYLLVSVTIDDPRILLSFTGVGTSGKNQLVHQSCLVQAKPTTEPVAAEVLPAGAVHRNAVLEGFGDLLGGESQC